MIKYSGNTMLKGAVVGIGGYGRTHLNCLDKLESEGRLKLVAAVHTGAAAEKESAEALRQKGCALYLDVDEMLNEIGDDLDFCTLPTSIGSHVPLALRCIERGIHCLVEKPLTGDRLQLEQLEQAMERRPEVLVTVGYQLQFLPEIMEARNRIAEGLLGRLKAVKVFGAWPRPASYFKRNDWAGRVRTPGYTVYDSPLNNAMAHYLNLGLYWAASNAGKPVGIRKVEGALYRAQAIENFDTASCRFYLDDSAPVGAWVTHSSRRQIDISVQVEGARGTMRWQPYQTLQWDLKDGNLQTKPTPRAVANLILYQAFIDSVVGLVRPECRNIQQAALHVQAIQAMQDSLTVQDVSPDQIDHFQQGSDVFTCIRDVEDRLLSGFESDTLITLPTA